MLIVLAIVIILSVNARIILYSPKSYIELLYPQITQLNINEIRGCEYTWSNMKSCQPRFV